MPPNTIYVGRRTPWGNIYVVGLAPCNCRAAGECSHNTFRRETAAEAVQAFRDIPRSEKALANIREKLRGKNLACWCGLCDRHKSGKPFGDACAECPPCHADVLLELANADTESGCGLDQSG